MVQALLCFLWGGGEPHRPVHLHRKLRRMAKQRLRVLLSKGERGGGAVHLQRLRTPPARVEERRQRRARGLRHRGRRGGHVSAAELLLRILWFAEWERHVVVANLHNLRQGAEEGGLQRAPLPRRRQSVPEGDALAVHLSEEHVGDGDVAVAHHGRHAHLEAANLHGIRFVGNLVHVLNKQRLGICSVQRKQLSDVRLIRR
mmetsp:Transcript_48022/g.91788  ORF Transcript_48022/g.91788 Transcript_48022/m.91788 type:complete len:201 (+) Transcript_48022:529-1131(+)